MIQITNCVIHKTFVCLRSDIVILDTLIVLLTPLLTYLLTYHQKLMVSSVAHVKDKISSLLIEHVMRTLLQY